MNDVQVSENFKLREFQCKGRNCCGGAVKLDSLLLQRLQAMRTEAGQPMIISSGYRCPVHNASVGGAATESQHLDGKAADFRIQNISMTEQVELAKKHFRGRGGIGYASSYTHVDTGPAREWQEGK